ncbi:MotA/TolQ/ExbB proton channel family protein [Methanosphaera sp. ISO3-F5]|uniref:MotA/TolQ/ExbB proton channel family protein n=1 Tax=Methanosphaera sp. ISO3-F5 TaxID=1452353 RepID=UPI002B25FA45|nr:MotA/TolQ/ExbB proton channel family protein [Methanosphaera sp. ISO3-F5]WQH64224.1 MotA/TolQ/ExbB proton channel family protein [Methanosphaera sp. ISO3-F5]
MATTIPGGDILSGILNVIAQSLLLPVMILLVIFIIFAVIEIGGILAEYTGRKKITGEEKETVIKKIAQSKTSDEICQIITTTKLNQYDKEVLTSIAKLDRTYYDKQTREILARNMLETQESKMLGSLTKVDIVAKVGSGCGLLGTIIPMGPGLAALGLGDMQTLTANLTTAFNTTTAGLAAGTVCYVIGKIRRKWYHQDINILYDYAETILEVDYNVPKTE